MLTTKIIIISLAVIGLFNLFLTNNFVFAASSAASAASELCTDASTCPIQSITGIYNVLSTIVQYTYKIFFIVAILFILFAAFTFLTAQGDPQKINSAKNQILWASVAVAIALLALSAQTIIRSILTSSSS